ncbi:BTAD domain-containing putative transcriptional regulator [Deinococcus radiotolerans]|uniref:Bacterial transcriptional activator domain-containing protein n=1 Tax=Deinococcus radiotolerans TaxID=1309407 RepID=A0ABQ2FRK8_9DEIO|nr:BTAD domain-containing putative transcriptional regulator [Deinococcus radiotolerans]GGL19636.1 hypothetical protein GCM10010844_43250 [Deinococcus radiotolerans]
MASAARTWQLSLLGPSMLTGGSAPLPLDGKPAALLTFLAAEGPQTRQTCAALLWPDTPRAAARNSLVQLLRRLHQAAGRLLILGQQTLALAPDLAIDLHRPPTPGEGVLLAELSGEISPAFQEWLTAHRVARDAAQNEDQRAAAEQLATCGNLDAALAVSAARTQLDPLDEDAHQQLMRLHHHRGDRAAALQAYHRLRTLLSLELGVDPSPDTTRLAQLIGTDAAQAAPPAVPLRFLRPPHLINREGAWAQMDAAWQAGAGLALAGAPGSGKTRLALEFIRAHPDRHLLLLQGRPGDQERAYTTHARAARQTLIAFPDVVRSLPDWVRRELSRILPELGGAPAPMTSAEDKLRLYDATYELLRRVAERGPLALLCDDLHAMDDASIEAGAYVHAKFRDHGAETVRFMFCYREEALSPAADALTRSMSEAGAVRTVQLPPLTAEDTRTLLAHVGLPDQPELALEIHCFAAGNPHLTLQLAKGLFEAQVFTPDAVRQAADRTLRPLLTERLRGLSPEALLAAQAAAVLGRDCSLEQVAELLTWPVLRLLHSWEELERAQMVRGEQFAHDLVHDAVLDATSATVWQCLQRRAGTLASYPVRNAVR